MYYRMKKLQMVDYRQTVDFRKTAERRIERKRKCGGISVKDVQLYGSSL